ncbi:MAG: hypothetical protein V4805_10675 [Pseudomonadota bacterium]
MPAACALVFDVFHYHHWRARWDSLVDKTLVIGGAPCPYVGAISENVGGGLLRPLSMRTQFIRFDRPRIAAATMLGQSFPFTRWAASMQHRELEADAQRSLMIYTYTLETGPTALRWCLEPIVKLIFGWQTRKRFSRMQAFLAQNADEVMQWQRDSGLAAANEP